MSFYDKDMGFFERVAFTAFAVIAAPVVIVANAAGLLPEDEQKPDDTKRSKLLDQQSKRTKVRKAAITQLLSKHRNTIKAQLANVIKKESFCVGEVVMTSHDDITYKIEFTGFDKTISYLNMANDIVLGRNIVEAKRSVSSKLITLQSSSSFIDEVVKKAESDYGSQAGIDSYDDYVELQDPFLNALKRRAI